MKLMKHIPMAILVALPLIAGAGVLDDAKAKIRKQSEDDAIASLGNSYILEIAKYKADSDRIGPKCYLLASEKWSMWTGMPKADFAACDAMVRQAILDIREEGNKAIALTKAERAERRKGMSEVATKLDEMQERQEERERLLDARDAARQADLDEDAKAKTRQEELEDRLAKARKEKCYWQGRKDC